MNIPSLAWRFFRTRLLPNGVNALAVALAVALTLSVLVLAEGARQSTADQARIYPMLIGEKGSTTQLVLSTMFQQDRSPGNIPHAVYEDLLEDPRVESAIRFGLGDNYLGHWIIGTDTDIFNIQVPKTDRTWLRIKEGRAFVPEAPEVVIGATVADWTGLGIGDTFHATHGLIYSEHAELDAHDDHEKYRVVGVLEPTGGPYDRVLLTAIETVWLLHEENGDENPVGDVTAVAVWPIHLGAQMALYNDYNQDPRYMAVFPAETVANVFRLVGGGERVLQGVSMLVLLMAFASVFAALYSAILGRRREISIMRALGAQRGRVLAMTLWESVYTALAGAFIGWGLGHLATKLTGYLVWQETGVTLTGVMPLGHQLLILLATTVLGAIAGLLPAIVGYRTNAVVYLQEGA